jgi:hypothetical protein
LAFQLNEWKTSNKMPAALQAKVLEALKLEFTKKGNSVMIDYGQFFALDAIINHAEDGLRNYGYPKGKITEVPLTIIPVLAADNVSKKYLSSLPKYTKDDKANHQLTIDNLLKKNPALMILLLEQNYEIESNYVLRDGQLTPILTNWLKDNGKMLLDKPAAAQRALTISPDAFALSLKQYPALMLALLEENHNSLTTQFLPLLNDWLKNNGKMLLDNPDLMKKALRIVPAAFKDFLPTLTDWEFEKCLKPIYYSTVSGQGNYEVIKAIPENKHHYFVNEFTSVFSMFASNGNVEGVKTLIDTGLQTNVDQKPKFSNQSEEQVGTALYLATSMGTLKLLKSYLMLEQII